MKTTKILIALTLYVASLAAQAAPVTPPPSLADLLKIICCRHVPG